jgi:hypothetical protein
MVKVYCDNCRAELPHAGGKLDFKQDIALQPENQMVTVYVGATARPGVDICGDCFRKALLLAVKP